LPLPFAPFLNWPTHLYDERFGFAWYTSPATFVNQIHQTHGTVEVARAVHEAIDYVLCHQADDIAKHGGLLIIHDWRVMTGYDSRARQEYLAHMRARKKGYLRHVVAVLPNTPLLRMAVETANIVMAFGSGGILRIENDPCPALEKHGVRCPDPSAWT
jgi:hypothetical protein